LACCWNPEVSEEPSQSNQCCLAAPKTFLS
jgi:hypothetical protein